jgi:hypothetical protein
VFFIPQIYTSATSRRSASSIATACVLAPSLLIVELQQVEVGARGVGMGFPRSVQWDESGTTLAIGTTGNAVCLVQPGDLTTNGKPNGQTLYCMQS